MKFQAHIVSMLALGLVVMFAGVTSPTDDWTFLCAAFYNSLRWLTISAHLDLQCSL